MTTTLPAADQRADRYPVSGPATGLAVHPVVSRALSWVAEAPDAPLQLGLCGPGGTGKSASLTALRAAYRAAGADVLTVRGRVGLRPGGLRASDSAAVLVDDAHLLPADALEWLLERADDDATRLVVAHRPWPRPAPLVDLVRELDARAAVVELGALDRSAVTALAHRRLGRPLPPTLVDDVLRLTAGLPRLVTLLLTAEALGSAPSSASAEGTATAAPRLPPDLLAQVDVDLGTTGSPRRRVVLALALGSTADPAVLAPALTLDPDVVAGSLQDARAAGLLLGDGTVVPVVAQAVLAACPPDDTRGVVEALVRAALDHGQPATAVAARFGGADRRSPQLAAAIRDAARARRGTDPAKAADLLGEAVRAGDPDPAVAVEGAECAALTGDLAGAARLTDAVLRSPGGPATPRAAAVAAAVLAHRGQLATAAGLLRELARSGAHTRPPEPDGRGAAGAAAALLGSGAAVALLGSGAADDEAVRLVRPDGTDGTTDACAHSLLAQGVHESLRGDGRQCLTTLARSSVLLGGDRPATLLADTPAALGALAALCSGEPGHAERLLHRALANGEGGPVAQPRHHLLLAWTAMVGGRCEESRARLELAAAAAPGPGPGGERDELVRRALEVGLARRSHDLGALTRAWPDAWEALLRHGVDLFMLLPLGELTVAAARLDRAHQVAPHVDVARELLAAAGDPALWGAPLHWYGVRAAIVAERPESVAPHAAALVRGAAVSRHAAMLAEAGKVWVQVLAGRVEPAAVERVARRLHAAGLGWDGARLAAHAAARTTDGRSGGRLLQVARDLRGGADRAGAVTEPATTTPTSRATGPGAAGAAVADPTSVPVPVPTPSAVRAPADDATPTSPPATARANAARAAQAARAAHGQATEIAIHLSERELEVARLVVAGHTYREISEQLYISAKTVEHHVARMRQRLGLESRAALLAHLRARVAARPSA